MHIGEPTFISFNLLLDKNPIAYKGSNQLQGFHPTKQTKKPYLLAQETDLQDKNSEKYWTWTVKKDK